VRALCQGISGTTVARHPRRACRPRALTRSGTDAQPSQADPPGEKGPGLATREPDHITSTAPSRDNGTRTGAGDGVSAALLAYLAGRRSKGARQRALTAHEARRRQDEGQEQDRQQRTTPVTEG